MFKICLCAALYGNVFWQQRTLDSLGSFDLSVSLPFIINVTFWCWNFQRHVVQLFQIQVQTFGVLAEFISAATS